MASEVEPPKYHRVGYFLPFIKPSFLSVILVFVCGILFTKNGETNDRLFALEQQMIVLTEECKVMRLNAREKEIATTVYKGESKRSTLISSMTESVFSSLSGRLNLVLNLRLIIVSTQTPADRINLILPCPISSSSTFTQTGASVSETRKRNEI